MKKGWIIGILGCPTGACSGVSLTEQLKIAKNTSIKNNRINKWEDIKLNGEKKIKLGNNMNVTVSYYDRGKYGKKIKVKVPCLDDKIIDQNEWSKIKKIEISENYEFIKKIEDGIKGYLNLLFSCSFKTAVEEASSNKWGGNKKLGRNKPRNRCYFRCNSKLIGKINENSKTNKFIFKQN